MRKFKRLKGHKIRASLFLASRKGRVAVSSSTWLVRSASSTSRGRRGGRKPVVTVDKLLRAKALVAKGLTVREVASRLKIGKTALYEALDPRTAV